MGLCFSVRPDGNMQRPTGFFESVLDVLMLMELSIRERRAGFCAGMSAEKLEDW